MRILALDTSTEACSVALWNDGAVVERFEIVRHGHSLRVLPMIEEVLAEAGVALAQCDVIAFGRGPGSFTSLRIGAGVTQGLAFGADLPVAPVSSLAALAQGQPAPRVLAAFDARMAQVYWGAYARDTQGLVELIGTEQVSAPRDVRLPAEGDWRGAGSGWDNYADQLQVVLDGQVTGWDASQFPHAAQVAELGAALARAGRLVAAEAAVPLYLRDDVARKSSAVRTV